MLNYLLTTETFNAKHMSQVRKLEQKLKIKKNEKVCARYLMKTI
jgi:hypothetical protein